MRIIVRAFSAVDDEHGRRDDNADDDDDNHWCMHETGTPRNPETP